jgi:hypothetical protein
MLRNNIAQTIFISKKEKKNPLFQYQNKIKQWTIDMNKLFKMNDII